MKKGICLAVALAFAFANSIAGADEVEDLKEQIEELRQDYQSKIQKLEEQVDALSKKQDAKTAQIEERLAKKPLDVEYVGRYEGPFGKGGLLIKNLGIIATCSLKSFPCPAPLLLLHKVVQPTRLPPFYNASLD